MKITLETLSPTRVKLLVEVPFADLEDRLAAAYKRIASQAKIPGFRPGKVPARVIDQRFGRGVVLQEAVNDALPGLYRDAAVEQSVNVLGQPDVEITELVDGEKLAFTAEVDVVPEFDVPDYGGIEVEVDDALVGEDEIDRQLDGLRRRFATMASVDRPAQAGDVIQLDIAGEIDGVPAEDYTISAYSHELGSNGLVDGLDDALVGVATGGVVVHRFVPEAGEHAGHEVTLNVTVADVRERELPAADDEFAQMASEFDSIDELVTDLGDRLARMRLMQQGFAAREKVLEALVGLVEIPVPQGMVDSQVEEHFATEHGEGHVHDHDVEDDEAHRAEVAEDVAKGVRTQFILDRVAEAEGLSVGQDELSQWLIAQAPRYQMSPDEFAKALVEAGQVQSAVADVRRAKAVDLIVAKAVIRDKSGNIVDLSVLEQPEQGPILSESQIKESDPVPAEAAQAMGPVAAAELDAAAAAVNEAERAAAAE